MVVALATTVPDVLYGITNVCVLHVLPALMLKHFLALANVDLAVEHLLITVRLRVGVSVVGVARFLSEVDPPTEHISVSSIVDLEGFLLVEVDLGGIVVFGSVEEHDFPRREHREFMLVLPFLTILLPKEAVLNTCEFRDGSNLKLLLDLSELVAASLHFDKVNFVLVDSPVLRIRKGRGRVERIAQQL